MNKYWIIKGTRQEGPFTLEQLKQMALPADIPVWREGLSDWTHAYDVPEIAPWTRFDVPAEEESDSVEDAAQEIVADQSAQHDTSVVTETTEEVAGSDGKEIIEETKVETVVKPQQASQSLNSKRKSEVKGREAEVIYAPIGEIPDGYMALTPETGKPKCPPSYLALSIVSAILFFLPLGVCAIFCSAKVEPHYQAGRYDKAYKMSNRAQLFIVLSIVCMLIWLPFSIIFAML